MLIDSLNDAQCEAVRTTDGPLRILAGAGTGKTRTLVARLVWILQCGQARPWEVLLVTFTNKAASEMRRRAIDDLHDTPELAGRFGNSRDFGLGWVGTFHALSLRMLRSFPEAVGLRDGFTLLDDDDQQRLVKAIAESLKIDTKRHTPRALLEMVQGWKDAALTPQQAVKADNADWVSGGKGIQLYEDYQARLLELNACDFSDLILHPIRAWQADADLRSTWQERFRYLMIDEYQDTNTAQYLWIQMLGEKHKNICGVGDEDQSIYSWRGAEIRNILRFADDFPGTKTVRLEENYRSVSNILEAAGAIVAQNKERVGKTLYSRLKPEKDSGVFVEHFWDDRGEATSLAERIDILRRRGDILSEMAILVRTVAQMREIEERFIAESLPYRVVGGLRFYERAEIRDAIAYLRLVHNDSDDLAFARIVNTPRRKIGATSVEKIATARRTGGETRDKAVARLIAEKGLRNPAAGNLLKFLEALQGWRKQAETLPLHEAAEYILEDSGYLPMWREDKSFEARGRVENLESFIAGLRDFESLAGFLEHVSLVLDAWSDESEPRVNLMTLHSAKGLEFDTVFLPGWEEGLFPHARSLDDPRDLEEERRLAYVGITRAKQRVYISYAASRRIFGRVETQKPSSFLKYLPQEVIETDEEMRIAQTGFDPSQATQDSVPSYRATGRGKKAQAIAKFAPQARVRHASYGLGTVSQSDDEWVEVVFEDGAERTILASYLTQE